MSSLPSGTLTFLFTDIEGSTQLWEKHPEAMKDALAQHDSILRQAIESNRGKIIKTTGDGIHSVFEKAMDAVQATLISQRAFKDPISGLLIRVRMGMHTGEAELRADDYYGQPLNRAARIMSIAHGGQVLLSSVSAELAREHLPADASLLDLGEHRLRDLVRSEHIYQLVAADLPMDFPALRSLNALPNNLPPELTSFIGRERELEETRKLLRNARLLTLIGPGGTGKTRLSIQLAADQLVEFKDGVWLVELASLSDPAFILSTIASVLELHEVPGIPLLNIVVDYLRARQLLLILDNCEHLLEACARVVATLLANCPKLRILATSRESLGLPGESSWRVPSLSLPAANEIPSVVSLAQFLGMTLWFSATAANAPIVAEFHLTPAETAWLTMAVQGGFVLGTLISALLNLPDLLSPRRLFAIGCVAGALANAALVAASGPLALIALRVATGAALAWVYPPGMKVAAGWFFEQRGMALGVLIGALTIGSAAWRRERTRT